MNKLGLKSFMLTAGISAINLIQNGVILDEKPKTSKQLRVYSWGWGNFGQLGLGNEKTYHLPQKVQYLENDLITQVEAKKSVSSAINAQGDVYVWGRAKGGILGLQDSNSMNISLPTKLNIEDKIVQISNGQNHSAAINDKGEVYTWGNSQHGKLGHTFEENGQVTVSKWQYNTRQNLESGALPQKIPNFSNIKQVSCGYQHTLLLNEDGEVFSLGQNRKGVLGVQLSQTETSIPRKIEAFQGKKIVKIDSGYDFNLAIDSDGNLYSWGNDEYGQLGSNIKKSLEIPQQVHSLKGIVDISCGDYFSAAIDRNGKLYTWGYGSDGQLGHSNNQDVRFPKEVNFDKKFMQVSCGGGHTGVVTSTNELYIFGRGKEGQLGREDLQNESEASYRNTPKQVVYFLNRKVHQIKCGGEHTIALVEEN